MAKNNVIGSTADKQMDDFWAEYQKKLERARLRYGNGDYGDDDEDDEDETETEEEDEDEVQADYDAKVNAIIADINADIAGINANWQMVGSVIALMIVVSVALGFIFGALYGR